MKLKLVLTLILCAKNIQAATFEQFCAALAAVESSNNARAFNERENAIGIYQIRPAYFQDAQDFDKSLTKYKHGDCYDRTVAKLVITAYFKRYAPKAFKNKNFEILAKLHNGGCQWMNKNAKTQEKLSKYWSKVSNKI
jgi:hypothetical protein